MRRRSTTSGAGAEPPTATRAAHPECARRPITAGRREVFVGPSLAAGWPIIGLLPTSSELAAEVAVEPGARGDLRPRPRHRAGLAGIDGGLHRDAHHHRRAARPSRVFVGVLRVPPL